jgi:hypothetical protein
VIHTAQTFAVHYGTQSVPPGPQHDAIVASLTAQINAQVLALLDQVFSALRLSLAVAIRQGFFTVLIFAVGVLLASLLLKDVPLVAEYHEEPGTGLGHPAPAEEAARV